VYVTRASRAVDIAGSRACATQNEIRQWDQQICAAVTLRCTAHPFGFTGAR
jgi:hypothetical protein